MSFIFTGAMGEVEEIFQPGVLAQLPGKPRHRPHALLHRRRQGAPQRATIMIDCNKGKVALGHNGTSTKRPPSGAASSSIAASIFQTNSDTEVIVHLIARSQARNLSGALGDALNQVEGAYSLVMLTQDELYAVRDPRGFRPLVLGS